MCKSVSGIYRININNKCYIGSAVNIKHRWMRHKKKSAIEYTVIGVSQCGIK